MITGATRGRDIMVSAGEASGDLHGATLARSLHALEPGRRVFGMGGARMREAGVDVIEDVTAAAVVGGSEAIGRVPRLYRAYRRLRAAIATERPAALVLIDFPEFNFRLAAAARARGIPVVYFVPPQLWAWRAGRVRTMHRLIARVLAVFPFELPLYRAAGVPVEFVGHPVVDAVAAAPSRDAARRALALGDDELVIGVLPGSRREEVDRVLPLMLDAAARIARVERSRFVLARASTIAREAVDRHLGGNGVRIEVVHDRAYEVIRAADLLLVASGTATLEAALLGTPMVVCYRVSRLTEAMGRLLIRVPWISVVNLALGRAVVPELYQDRATGAAIADEALRLVRDAGVRRAQHEAFAELRAEFGAPGVGPRAARAVLATAAS